MRRLDDEHEVVEGRRENGATTDDENFCGVPAAGEMIGEVIRHDACRRKPALRTRPDQTTLEDMIMKNISAAKAELSSLIERVQKGEEVLIAKAGRPVARLVPYEGIAGKRVPGALRGKIKIAADFDVLPDEIARAFGVADE